KQNETESYKIHKQHHIAAGASNGGDDGASASSSQQPQQQQQQQQQHINDIFRLPDSDAGIASSDCIPCQPPHPRGCVRIPEVFESAKTSSARMDGGAADDNSEAAAAPPPPTAAQLRRRSGRRSQARGRRRGGCDNVGHPAAETDASVDSRKRGGASGGCGGSGAGGRRLSSIEMMVQNEDGEAEEVEIDVADTEDDVVARRSRKRCRKQPIADRISRRRNSEVAADIIRMSAAHRRREFAALIDEHQAIVRELEGQKPQQQHQPAQRCPGRVSEHFV
uniref:Transcription factor kayak n=1 Tax=Macrostomum lignano TaxID=282301 RepID=A0A1I8FCJ2_9PLAT